MKPRDKRPSLISQHLRILGFDAKSARLQPAPMDAPALAAEVARLAAIELQPLRLPEHTASPSNARPFTLWILGGIIDYFEFSTAPYAITRATRGGQFAAFAGCVALVLLSWVAYQQTWPRAQTDDKLRVKGQNRVWLYWERDGDVQPWTKDSIMRNGDRVRAEVLAGETATAVMAIINADDVLLTAPDHVEETALHLSPGERRSFPGSVKLVGQNEGERLMVIICGQPSAGPSLDLKSTLRASLVGQNQQLKLSLLPANCRAETFTLRSSAAPAP